MQVRSLGKEDFLEEEPPEKPNLGREGSYFQNVGLLGTSLVVQRAPAPRPPPAPRTGSSGCRSAADRGWEVRAGDQGSRRGWGS